MENKFNDSKDVLHRAMLFMFFLACGLTVFVAPIFMTGDTKTVYRIIITAPFLVAIVLLRRSNRLEKHFQVLLAFFTAALAFALEQVVVGAVWPIYREGILPSSIDGIVFQKILSTVSIVASIVLLTKFSGNSMDSIYLKKGRLRIGLIIGAATFLFFLATAIPSSTMLFGGRDLTVERVVSWSPWILAFVFANGLREELWYRGLFLKRYETVLGAGTANLLQAVIFSLSHLGSHYTPALLIFLAITFLLGLAFGAVAQKTNSLLGSILFHAGTDVPVVLGYFSNI
ncbi:MAG: CPBP family intramembrane metalloprotease [Thaumarchaeota archaeon]|nr:CPBP family intramembrane metalloprotease [Nitrososphaerota archaeon]MCL5317652.1 CPBP family intramembrane metalloprotease [Nitrososphaerota archaeon]